MLESTIGKLVDELESLGKTREDAWQIPRVEGEMLHQIALASGAQLIVEVGTSYGFSGLFWGAALKITGGRLITIDISQKKFDSSRATFARAGLSGIIENRLGDAREVLRELAGPIDLAFIDAEKPDTRAYFDLLWPRLRAGGSVLIDNALTHRAELAGMVQHLRGRTDASSTEIAIGNGVEWTIKLR
jgi:predicted O-methyltransferase YrrM